MNLSSFLLILTGVLLNAGAQLLLKAGTNTLGHLSLRWNNLIPLAYQVGLEPHIIGGLGCYAISVVVWILALSRVPVSMAYPLLSIGYIINALIAQWWLGEFVSPMRWFGIFIILVGVIFVTKS
jgi:multidrug transporter EmrE-like cation transporter